MGYDDDDSDDDRDGPARLIGLGATLLSLAALGWVVITQFQDNSLASTESPASSLTVDAPASSTTSPDGATDDNDIAAAADVGTSSSATTTTTTTASTSTSAAAPPAATRSEATSPDTRAAASATYPTLPDGSPVPVLAVFDTDTVTISGVVPNEDAAARLEGLAIANSKFPDAELVSNLTFDPAVPPNVGVRVIEMNSVRFPESTADLLPEHRTEIDRAAGILSLFPRVSVLVIGHADQRGDSDTNFAISEERARTVSSYLVSSGINPSRVSSRAVGELDLLALDNDAQSFALNRRTEFVFYGLLAEPV